MAIAQEPTKWTMPLGVNADANDIPDTAPEYTGNVSMNSVFPPITQLPLEAGGIAPTRADFNGLFKLLGASIYYLQRGGIFSYADDVDYPVGAVVKFENGIYIAIQANGPASTVADPTDPDYWRHLTTTVNNQYADADGNVSLTSVAHATSADNGVEEAGINYIRFKNGVQICWQFAYNKNTNGTGYSSITYVKPFKDDNVTFATMGASSIGAVSGTTQVIIDSKAISSYYAIFYWMINGSVTTQAVGANLIYVGYWK